MCRSRLKGRVHRGESGTGLASEGGAEARKRVKTGRATVNLGEHARVGNLTPQSLQCGL